MNTIAKIIALAWVHGSAINKALRDAESREAVWVTGLNPRFVYGAGGQRWMRSPENAHIVIEVEADTQ